VSDTALVIAHPGHELRVFGWATQNRPTTFVLTRGDGHAGASRICSTSRVIEDIGAAPGAVYGRFTDRDIYDVLLQERHSVLIGLRDELAAAFVDGGTSLVACDAEEWYNPSHDVCRYLTMAAARKAERMSGKPIRVVDFPLVGAPDDCPPGLRDSSIRVELDDELFGRKIRHALEYPELKSEVERALAANGANAFRVECLRPASRCYQAPSDPPFYERYGDQQVAAGHYREVIRFSPHIRGVREALEWEA
jgi:hypothetical protein